MIKVRPPEEHQWHFRKVFCPLENLRALFVSSKSRISRLKRSTTQSKGLTRILSKVPCMTGWSFNLSVELQFRNCKISENVRFPLGLTPSTAAAVLAKKKIMKKIQYVLASLITNVTLISDAESRLDCQSKSIFPGNDPPTGASCRPS
ncbi:hypothetical protein TNCV_4487831 [Trichonephila clavipes]|nr:hypothetical protein TNCV_4487831 [Trichonephila clavipes]